MNNNVQLLIDARALIAKESNWTKQSLAEKCINPDCEDEKLWDEVHVSSPYAVRFCALGALERAAHYRESNYNLPLRYLIDAIPKDFPHNRDLGYVMETWTVTDYNDDHDRTHEEVLSVYDRAIELAKERVHHEV